MAKTRAEYEAEASKLIQAKLLNHDDPGVRAMAAIAQPPVEAVKRIADALQAKDQEHG